MPELDFHIDTERQLAQTVKKLGILPFFKNSIKGFSIEEHVSERAWFSSEPGVWEWKGPLIRENGFAYGKFFEKKAAFVTLEWFRELANYRRDGYDFDALFDDELASYREKNLFDLINGNAPILTKNLKELGNYKKDGNKGFETDITKLQTKCYVLIDDFIYMKDKHGKEYGWGVAEYSTPEKFFGSSFTDGLYNKSPRDSYAILYENLRSLAPDADERTIKKFLS